MHANTRRVHNTYRPVYYSITIHSAPSITFGKPLLDQFRNFLEHRFGIALFNSAVTVVLFEMFPEKTLLSYFLYLHCCLIMWLIFADEESGRPQTSWVLFVYIIHRVTLYDIRLYSYAYLVQILSCAQCRCLIRKKRKKMKFNLYSMSNGFEKVYDTCDFTVVEQFLTHNIWMNE